MERESAKQQSVIYCGQSRRGLRLMEGKVDGRFTVL